MVTSAVDPIRKSGKFDICLISLNEKLGDGKKTLHRDIKTRAAGVACRDEPGGRVAKKAAPPPPTACAVVHLIKRPVNQVESTTFTHPSSGGFSPRFSGNGFQEGSEKKWRDSDSIAACDGAAPGEPRVALHSGESR